jgi:protein-tyrosine phosphatase
MDVAAPRTTGGHPDADDRHARRPRTLELRGVYNFRDLGGYRARDGRTVRWHTLFRADGLDRLTPEDVEALRPFGLRTVVDLRMEHELAARGRFPVETYPVAYHHLSVMDRTWDRDIPGIDSIPEADFLHARYTEMLQEGGPRYAAALRVLAGAGALPAVFHCAAGKDRTGLLAMLVLGAIGVSHDDIVEDYALSSRALAAFRERAAEDPQAAAALASTPTVFFAADPTAMSRLLTDIEAAHGSVRGYAKALGVDESHLTALEHALLSD